MFGFSRVRVSRSSLVSAPSEHCFDRNTHRAIGRWGTRVQTMTLPGVGGVWATLEHLYAVYDLSTENKCRLVAQVIELSAHVVLKLRGAP